jgi:hypothetical protein
MGLTSGFLGGACRGPTAGLAGAVRAVALGAGAAAVAFVDAAAVGSTTGAARAESARWRSSAYKVHNGNLNQWVCNMSWHHTRANCGFGLDIEPTY